MPSSNRSPTAHCCTMSARSGSPQPSSPSRLPSTRTSRPGRCCGPSRRHPQGLRFRHACNFPGCQGHARASGTDEREVATDPNALITLGIELLFAIVFLRALITYLRDRDPLSRDITLVFSAMAALFVLQLVTQLVGPL